MNRHRRHIDCKSKELFRLRFQRLFRDFSVHACSAAESFGPAWEKAMEEVPLEETQQAEVYGQLIRWAKEHELFTGLRETELLHAWRDTVHEL
jgi:hypothetical protein